MAFFKCKICGKDFVGSQTQDRKYCSWECYTVKRGSLVVYDCLLCGKKAATKPSTIKYGGGRYCGHSCAMKATMTGRVFTNEHKDKLSKLKKGKTSHMKGKTLSSEIKLTLSNISKDLWQSGEYVKKQMKARGCQPNKVEMELLLWLNEWFPNEWKYVGDGQVIIHGKCPDYINSNGKKMIIELYGDYWHRGQNPKDREKIFEEFGYKTLVIWESEMKAKNSLHERLDLFIGGLNKFSPTYEYKGNDENE